MNDIIGILGSNGFFFSKISGDAKDDLYQLDYGDGRAQIAEIMSHCKN